MATAEAAKKKRRLEEKEEEEDEERKKKQAKGLTPTQPEASPVQEPVPVPDLPRDVCHEIAKHVHENEALALSLTCKRFRDAMKEALRVRKNAQSKPTKKKRSALSTIRVSGKGGLELDDDKWLAVVTEDWIKWAFALKWEYAKDRRDNEWYKISFLTRTAARCGFKDVLCWLRNQGCELNKFLSRVAAGKGQLEVLQYLHSEGAPFDSITCKSAAEGGHLEVLQYLKSIGMYFDTETGVEAAYGGHVEVLKYLKNEGVRFGAKACYWAACQGHFDALKWLRSINCPWNIDKCLSSCMYEDICFEYYVEGGIDKYRMRKEPVNREMVEWIRSFLPK